MNDAYYFLFLYYSYIQLLLCTSMNDTVPGTGTCTTTVLYQQVADTTNKK